MLRSLLAATLLVGSCCAAAATATVESLQSPAWVERSGVREPLAIGMALAHGDRVVSGADARVMLRMPEGSVVKLGEQAQLALDRLAARREPQGTLVDAALNVVRGAFRFTTQAGAAYRGRRQVDVRLATVTAGIRGTDLWGKSAEDREIVCLIEGRIDVQRAGEAAFVMDQPLSFYIAPRDAPALPVQPVPAAQLEQWALETELRPGAGGARRNGRWGVELAQFAAQSEALTLYDAVRAAGYPARIAPLPAAGGWRYSVRVASLADEAEARGLAERLKTLPGVAEPRAYRG